MDFKEFLFALTHDWVSLMSGIASVIITMVGVAKKWDQIPRWVFWVAAIVCFFFASCRIWTTQHRARLAVEEQLKQLTIPSLVGHIEYVAFLPSKQGDVAVALFASIDSGAAPSFADIGPVKVILSDGKRIELITIGVPANGIQILPTRPGELPAHFPRQDYLPIKARSPPIQTGGAVLGWTWGLAQGVSLEKISSPDTKIVLDFTDIKGKPYEVQKRIGDVQVQAIDPNSVQ
jgi:hypothetical protein